MISQAAVRPPPIFFISDCEITERIEFDSMERTMAFSAAGNTSTIRSMVLAAELVCSFPPGTGEYGFDGGVTDQHHPQTGVVEPAGGGGVVAGEHGEGLPRPRPASQVTQGGPTLVLIGPGRWGTRDPRMGIRVGYSGINNTRMLIEIARRKGDYAQTGVATVVTLDESGRLISRREVAFDGGEQWGMNHMDVEVVVTVDPQDLVDETTEDNNRDTRTVPV